MVRHLSELRGAWLSTGSRARSLLTMRHLSELRGAQQSQGGQEGGGLADGAPLVIAAKRTAIHGGAEGGAC